MTALNPLLLWLLHPSDADRDRRVSEPHFCSVTFVQLCAGMSRRRRIMRAQKHGNRWSARWTGGAGECVCVSSALQQTRTKTATRRAISCSSRIMCKGLIRNLLVFTFKYCRRASSSAFLIESLYTVSNLEIKT